jgi:hypothetical protein
MMRSLNILRMPMTRQAGRISQELSSHINRTLRADSRFDSDFCLFSTVEVDLLAACVKRLGN